MPRSQDAGLLNQGRTQLEGSTLHDHFKLTKQLSQELRPSLKNNAPHAASLREMGASFDMGSKVGMIKVNSAESTKIKPGPEIGKGGLVDEVF